MDHLKNIVDDIELSLYEADEPTYWEEGTPMSISEQAKQVYEQELKAQLEGEHRDKFVAIEPASKSYFLGETFIAAALAAKEAFPGRKSFVLRIGHDAAFHLGAASS